MRTFRLCRRSSIAWSLAAAVLVPACNLHNPGVTPDEAAISYPAALALSSEASPRFLYVANSNFDLRYNSGSVHVYDLMKLDQMLAKYACRTLDKTLPLSDGGTFTVPNYTRYPSGGLDAGDAMDASASGSDAGEFSDASSSDDGGSVFAGTPDAGPIVLSSDYAVPSLYGDARGSLCDDRDPPAYANCCFYRHAPTDTTITDHGIDDIRASSMRIDSFATGIAAVARPDGSQRLYVPISSRSRLVYLDVHDGILSCGDQTDRCTRGPWLHGPDDVPNDSFPGQPSAIAVGTLSQLVPDGSLPVGNLSPDTTFIATAHELGGFGLFLDEIMPPALESAPVLESVLHGLPSRPTSVLLDPAQRVIYSTSANAPFLSRIGLRIDATERPAQQTDGKPAPRELLYQSSAVYVTGLSQPSDIRSVALDPNDPAHLYALVRGTQESVAFLEVDPYAPNFTEARLIGAVRVGAGPSKMLRISIDGRPFLVVSCYDAGAIFVIDPVQRELVAVVRNLSGPFEMAFDASRNLLHVADFRVSVLRVVDMAGVVDKTEPPPRIVATLGLPRFEGGLE